MVDINDRKDAFLNKFAHDNEMRFKMEMRRNKLLGLWAAEIFGLSGDEAETYAKTVIVADMEEAGDEDVFRKVRGDFDERGVEMSDADIRAKMSQFLDEAIAQLSE